MYTSQHTISRLCGFIARGRCESANKLQSYWYFKTPHQHFFGILNLHIVNCEHSFLIVSPQCHICMLYYSEPTYFKTKCNLLRINDLYSLYVSSVIRYIEIRDRGHLQCDPRSLCLKYAMIIILNICTLNMALNNNWPSNRSRQSNDDFLFEVIRIMEWPYSVGTT